MAVRRAGQILISIESGAAKFARDMQEAAASTRRLGPVIRSVGSDAKTAGGEMRSASREASGYAAAIFLGAKALAAQVAKASALEAALNRLRAARVAVAGVTEGLGGASVVGAEIAAVVAIEKLAKSTFDRAKEIQRAALAAAKTGFSIEDTGALQFAAGRIGKRPDYFDSAVRSAGGVDQLAKKLRELAAIEDPLARAKAAFEQFGPDAEKVLANLGDRFGDNIDKAKAWGFALDEVARGKIDGFNRDVIALKGTFDSLTDAVAASKQTLVSLLQLDFAGVYDVLIGGTGDIIGKIRTAAGNVVDDPNASFKDITKGAQKALQQRQSQDMLAQAQKQMLASLTAPAEKSFSKDYFGRDQEAGLRADIDSLRNRLFVQDRTSPEFGKLTSGASFPGGYGAQAESVQKLTSDQAQLMRVLEHKKELKDADEAARKAAQALEAAQRAVAAALQSAQLSELSGADKLRAERDSAIAQYGKTKALIEDINKEFDIRFGIEGRAIQRQSDADLQKRAAAEAQAQEAQLVTRSKYASDAILSTIRISGEAPNKRDEVATQGADFDREAQLRQLESFNAKTLSEKTTIEAAKFQIESAYLVRVRDLESAGIDRSYQKQLQELKVLVDAKLITEKAFNDEKRALDENEELDLLKLHEKTDAEIQKSGIAAAKGIREAYQAEFAKIQQALDSVLSRISDNFASMIMGEKTEWSRMFLDMGHEMTSRAIKGGLQTLLAPLERRAVLGGQDIGLPGADQVGDTVGTGDTLAGTGIPGRVFGGLLARLLGRGNPGNILFGNGGLLGTGQVPRIAGDIGSASPVGLGSGSRPEGSLSNPFGVILAPGGVGPNGTAGNPFYVIVAGSGFGSTPVDLGRNMAKPQGPNLLMEIGGIIGAIGNIGTGILGGIRLPSAVGGGDGGGDKPDVSSTVSYPGYASGGDVEKGRAIIVGEKGHELFIPRSDGRIVDHQTTKRMLLSAPLRLTSRADGGAVSAGQSYMVGERGPEAFITDFGNNQEFRRTQPSGGGNAYYTIDARGTDPNLVDQRVRQALVLVHRSAISTSVQVSAERSRRVPG